MAGETYMEITFKSGYKSITVQILEEMAQNKKYMEMIMENSLEILNFNSRAK